MLTALRIAVLAAIPVVMTAVLYLMEKKTPFGQMDYWFRQITVGLIFGGIAIINTEFGVVTPDAVVNVRDAAPICAALIFGAPAGILAGLLGGVERLLAVLWGASTFTAVTCAIATSLSGILAAQLRKNMFDTKKPTWYYALAIGVEMEVLHMLLQFASDVTQVEKCFQIVQSCAAPMITANGLSVMLAVIVVRLIDREPSYKPNERNTLSHAFQRGLAICVLIAFVTTMVFTTLLQLQIQRNNTNNMLKLNIEDVREDISEALEDPDTAGAVKIIAHNRHIGDKGYIIIADENWNIVSDSNGYDGQNIESTGISIDTAKIPENTRFTAKPGDELAFCMYASADSYYIVSVYPYSEAVFSRNVAIYITTFMELLVFATIFTLIYFMIKRLVVNNIDRINGSLAEITDGNLDVVVDVRTNKEFSTLSDDINSTVDTLKRYIAEAAARIDKELEFARSIQHAALPSVFPPYPNRTEFDIFASMDTAKEVGGDFYDFYFLRKSKLAFLIADVSGKGIPAAMFMMRAKTLFKSLAESGRELDEVIFEANNQLSENNDSNMFVTAWVGILDMHSGKLTYVNAGHNPPILKKADGSVQYLRNVSGLIVGVMEDAPYKKYEITLEKDDVLYLYTDGVTEAMNEKDEQYGEDRLQKLFEQMQTGDVTALTQSVTNDLSEHVGTAEQSDDITMLAIRWNGSADPQ